MSKAHLCLLSQNLKSYPNNATTGLGHMYVSFKFYTKTTLFLQFNKKILKIITFKYVFLIVNLNVNK